MANSLSAQSSGNHTLAAVLLMAIPLLLLEATIYAGSVAAAAAATATAGSEIEMPPVLMQEYVHQTQFPLVEAELPLNDASVEDQEQTTQPEMLNDEAKMRENLIGPSAKQQRQDSPSQQARQANLQQQQQQQQQKQQLKQQHQHLREELQPAWLQMHDEPQAEQQQQQHNNKAYLKLQTASQAPTQPHPHPHAHSYTTTTTTATILNSNSARPSYSAPLLASPHRRCSIEVTNQIPGICQPMAPIGSACVAGEYMDVFNLDCM